MFHPGSADWAKLLGIPLRWVGDTYPQGVPALLDAAGADRDGQATTVLIVGGQAGVLGGPAVASYTRPDNEFVACWGSLTAAQFALVAQVYLHRFRPDPERGGDRRGDPNEGSPTRTPCSRVEETITAADVLASPLDSPSRSACSTCASPTRVPLLSS